MDNFASNAGLSGDCFGLVYADLQTQNRTPKMSAAWLREAANRNSVAQGGRVMHIDAIPIAMLFVGAFLLVMGSIEVGYRVGRMVGRSEVEKESPVSTIAASVLGLLAFILAFTFGLVSQRFDTRRAEMREQANAIRTAYLRSDFLPEADRAQAKELLREYVVHGLAITRAFQSGEITSAGVEEALPKAERIQANLWDMAVVNARKDMNSDVAALYIDSLNRMAEVQASRVAISLQQRIPTLIWLVLCSLTFLGMAVVGYQAAIVGSKRSLAQPVLAVTFSMVVALIACLDRPGTLYIKVSQQPLIDLYNSMTSGGAPAQQTQERQ